MRRSGAKVAGKGAAKSGRPAEDTNDRLRGRAGKSGGGSTEVDNLLSLMRRNADLIHDGLHGTIELPSRAGGPGIEELVNARVLLPINDEGSYYLNPQLRNFIGDSLNHFHAAEQFTRVRDTIRNIRRLLRQICELQGQGEIEDAERIEDTLGFEVHNLMYTYLRNLQLFHAQLSTDYGNVSSLKAKLLQNEDYQRQVSEMLSEGVQVVDLIEEVTGSQSTGVTARARNLIILLIGSKASQWASQLNEVQAIISKRRFDNQLLEQQVVNLSRLSLWLQRNPTITGFDVQLSCDVNVAALRPEAIRIRPQFDPGYTHINTQQQVSAVLGKLPAAENPFNSTPQPQTVQRVRRRGMSTLAAQIDPIDRSILSLVRRLKEPDAGRQSLRQWALEIRRASGVDDEAWLLYSATQLCAQGIEIEYLKSPRKPGDYNARFRDIIALPVTPKAAQPLDLR